AQGQPVSQPDTEQAVKAGHPDERKVQRGHHFEVEVTLDWEQNNPEEVRFMAMGLLTPPAVCPSSSTHALGRYQRTQEVEA
ncbi:hypothetical protein LEMLEM_LOCUS300, partial [Lemmus lemmus]